MSNDSIKTLLFSVLKGALRGECVPREIVETLSAKDWGQFLVLSQQHNIIPLVCDGLCGLRGVIPSMVFAKIAALTAISEDKYERRVSVVRELATIMAEKQIPVLILKGYGMSLYYPNPKHRLFSDVDTYHFGSHVEADKTLKEILGVDIDVDVHHHTTCVYKGVLVENHYDFINTTQHKSYACFEQILKAEASQNVREHEVGNTNILLPSAMFNALFLMRHMAMHYAAERVSLRHLCDWMLFVAAEHQNIDWERVNAIYEQFNMKRFADAITGICIDNLGMSADYVPGVHRDKALEARILNDIIFAEFGEKMPEKGFFRIVWWKTRRYFANSWKHKLIYKESWVWTFFQASWAHLIKPKTITH